MNEVTSIIENGNRTDVPQDVPQVENNFNKESSTSETTKVEQTGGTLGSRAETDVRKVFRASKTFKVYFEANCNDETYIAFLDVCQNFLELSDAEFISKEKACCKYMIISFVPFGPNTIRGTDLFEISHPVSYRSGNPTI